LTIVQDNLKIPKPSAGGNQLLPGKILFFTGNMYCALNDEGTEITVNLL